MSGIQSECNAKEPNNILDSTKCSTEGHDVRKGAFAQHPNFIIKWGRKEYPRSNIMVKLTTTNSVYTSLEVIQGLFPVILLPGPIDKTR